MSYEEYQRLKGPQPNILDLLAMPGMEDIEFEVGERPKDPPREVEFD